MCLVQLIINDFNFLTKWIYLPLIEDLRWACSKAVQISSSVWDSNGSKFIRKVPENNTGSCGIIVNFDRRVCNPTFDMSSPSIKILPLSASNILKKIRDLHASRNYIIILVKETNLKSANVNELFPEPVRPTIPIFSPAIIWKVKSWSTGSESTLYFTYNWSKLIWPSLGHSEFKGSLSSHEASYKFKY